MAGSSSDADYVLSAVNATLTETDDSNVEHIHDSAQSSATVQGTRVQQGPTTTQHQVTTNEEKVVTVYRQH